MPIEKHAITSRDQWLNLRKSDLTASDIGAVLGMSPYRSAAAVLAEKLGLLTIERDDPVLERGEIMEPAILKKLHKLRPKWTLKSSGVYLRDTDNRLGATPDAFATDPEREGFGVLQLKSVAKPVYVKGWCGGDPSGEPDVPMPYLLQTLTEASLAEAAAEGKGPVWAMLVVLIMDAYALDMKLIPVERDARAEENVRSVARTFWLDVEAGRRPEFNYKVDSKVVELFYPRETADELDLEGDNELAVAVADYCSLRTHKAEIEERMSELQTMFKAKLGTAAAAKLADGYKMSWRSQTRKEHVVPAASFRVLRVTAPRAKAKTEADGAEANKGE